MISKLKGSDYGDKSFVVLMDYMIKCDFEAAINRFIAYLAGMDFCLIPRLLQLMFSNRIFAEIHQARNHWKHLLSDSPESEWAARFKNRYYTSIDGVIG